MFDLLRKAFGQGGGIDFAGLVGQGAQIVDVRSPAEFRDGHVEGSVNIPLPNLASRLSGLPKDRPVITCCASGARSATAKSILEAGGFSQVHNGGGWRSLQDRLR